MNPTISIIVPVYNQEKYLSRCLDSILAQTFTDFEVLCVNDHSTDSTSEILQEYSEKDSRIVALENPGKGVSDARNYGIDNAKGEYIGFVDSDDFIQPQMYEFLFRAIKENQTVMSVCSYAQTTVFEEKSFDYCCREVQVSEFAGDLHSWGKDEMVMSGAWSKLIEASFLKKHAKFEKFRIGEDTVFCAELWSNADKVFLVDLPLYGYFTNLQSVTKTTDESRFADLIKTRYRAYEIYNGNDRQSANYFLVKCFLLLVRCKAEDLLKNEENIKIRKEYFKKSFIPFLKLKSVSFKEKLFYIIKYLF